MNLPEGPHQPTATSAVPITADGVEWSIVIPAWNEALRIIPTLGEVASYFRHRKANFEVIVVDDGSSDKTIAVIEEVRDQFPELNLIRHPLNRGKGAAVRSGMVAAKGRLHLFLDADGSTPIREVERLERAIRNGAQIAIGSRAMPEADVTLIARWHRRLLGRMFNAAINLIVVPGIRDTQCGFKLFTQNASQRLFPQLKLDGFSFDLEILWHAHRMEIPISEIAVDWQHRSGSKVRLWRDGPRMLRDAVMLRFRAL